MFNSSKKSAENSSIDTMIGSSTNIEGTINSKSSIRIDGRHTGNITCESIVVVGENGYIKGDITAASISISGRVDGNITSKGLLEILPGGRLVGDIEVQNISISDGAIFKGNCNMLIDNQPIENEPQNIEESDGEEEK